ncbi:unnamed protein product [Peniophora sp. CBMAI 1063]|nr:unnamed protein product [Peniophora sp. CBMAI 1063]
MIPKEANTGASAKDLIVAVSGADDAQWDNMRAKETERVSTVRSELRKSIHKVATRTVKSWTDLNDTVFELPRAKREPWVEERREEVIGKLNQDFYLAAESLGNMVMRRTFSALFVSCTLQTRSAGSTSRLATSQLIGFAGAAKASPAARQTP